MNDKPDHRGFSWHATGRGIQNASVRAFDLSERAARRGWRSQKRRVSRWRSRLFIIIQISLAAGLSWWIAQRLLGHETPFLAVVASIVCLGFSFGQRLWRAAEIAIGVTVGVALGDLFWHWFGHGVWQIMLVIAVAMSITTWLGARTLMVTQAAVQASIVLTIPPSLGAGFSRWTDALIGCAVALAFATVAPVGPVERPRLQAAKVLHETASSIRSMVTALTDGDEEAAEEVLARARATESQLSELTAALNEGVAVVRTSPFLRHRRQKVLEIADIAVPLDRFTRNLRVLARRSAMGVYRGEKIPATHLRLLGRLAEVTDACAVELFARRRPDSKIDDIAAVGVESSLVPLEAKLSSTVIVAQVRSMLVDLLELCGLDYTDARELVPQMKD
ncbi:FUSC family protein [Tessaracoccus sp. OS52]|uniref:FUSC family protein n=1 Tax=Tessaracoccus sp. OS52 TaxID=2886691 RepID=UPI001D0FD97B|nr:FUSC family protein [Tessaracoccus sp. OS52]